MHAYATDSNERRNMVAFIVVISVFLAWLLNCMCRRLSIAVPWWIDAPSVWGFFGLLYHLFDKYLWRIAALRTAGIVHLWDFSGTWHGHVTSCQDGHSHDHPADLRIRQTWTNIMVRLESANSRSRSLVGTLATETGDRITLRYEYINEPKSAAPETMHTHRGTAVLEMMGDELHGEYYTGRDRQTHGAMKFCR